MVIEESVHIDAPLDKVWKSFTDLTCWRNWNSVMKDVASDSPSIEKGGAVSFCLRPFIFPVNVEPYATQARNTLHWVLAGAHREALVSSGGSKNFIFYEILFHVV